MAYQHVYAGDVEIEYRLGKTNGRFVSLSKEQFTAVTRSLEECDSWDKIETSNTVDTFYADGVRCSSDGTVVKKRVLQTIPYTLGRWTVRLAVSREIPQDVESLEIKYIRSKHRTSYIKDFYSIDLSVVNNETYELEVELWNKQYVMKHSFQFIHNHVMRVLQNVVSASNI